MKILKYIILFFGIIGIFWFSMFSYNLYATDFQVVKSALDALKASSYVVAIEGFLIWIFATIEFVKNMGGNVK